MMEKLCLEIGENTNIGTNDSISDFKQPTIITSESKNPNSASFIVKNTNANITINININTTVEELDVLPKIL